MDKRTFKLNEIETFVFIHDQDLLLELIHTNKFSQFKNLTWVFLGMKNTEKIKNLSNLIIVNQLENNIEEYPKFTSFTGWYALCKNDLIKSEFVNLFEYDVIVNRNISMKEFDFSETQFIGYFPMSVSDPVFIDMEKYSSPLINSIKNKTNIDVINIINSLPKNYSWSSSSNSTWNVDVLKNYITWFESYIDDIKDDKYCGHMFERSISFYHFINEIKYHLTIGFMEHLQINSHGTSPLSNLRSQQMLKKLLS